MGADAARRADREQLLALGGRLGIEDEHVTRHAVRSGEGDDAHEETDINAQGPTADLAAGPWQV